MTWTIQIDGHDDLEAEAKAAFENGLVGMAKQLVTDIQSGAGITVSRAQATTNTTGPVDLLTDLLPNAGGGEDAEEVPADEAEAAEGEEPTE